MTSQREPEVKVCLCQVDVKKSNSDDFIIHQFMKKRHLKVVLFDALSLSIKTLIEYKKRLAKLNKNLFRRETFLLFMCETKLKLHHK